MSSGALPCLLVSLGASEADVGQLTALFKTGWHLSLPRHTTPKHLCAMTLWTLSTIGAGRQSSCHLDLKGPCGAVIHKSVGFVWVAHRLGAPQPTQNKGENYRWCFCVAPCWLLWMAVQGQSLCLLGSALREMLACGRCTHSLHGMKSDFTLFSSSIVSCIFYSFFVSWPAHLYFSSSTTCAFSHI